MHPFRVLPGAAGLPGLPGAAAVSGCAVSGLLPGCVLAAGLLTTRLIIEGEKSVRLVTLS